jgi:hypothetical protein
MKAFFALKRMAKMANKYKVIYYFNSRDPLMLLISHLKHHYSARRFTHNGDLWIFDSCNKYPYKDKTNCELFRGLLNHIEVCVPANIPFIQEIIVPPSFQQREYGAIYRDYEPPKTNKVSEYLMTFQREPIIPPTPETSEPTNVLIDLESDGGTQTQIEIDDPVAPSTPIHDQEQTQQETPVTKLESLVITLEEAMQSFHAKIEQWKRWIAKPYAPF